MEVGASLVAFIGFGLASIKTSCQFVSSIKDGPEKLRDLGRVLASLRAAYEHTSSLGGSHGSTCSSQSLVHLIRQCNEDVSRFETKIGRLSIQPRDRMHGILWKRLKVAINEKDVAHMLSVMSGYLNALTLEISVIHL
ncbi:uncharacterized protein CTRU02_200237 [Colletotrichum truncatum]|uniref:Uncharacterized protein n=1 Tax=Colletotrichum truncatum TaxID=5467 RepID=A0ACC3ZE13_COLTU|nr:uncharacterized protein CTRU02_05116 [Colletotrichum truncatum]KAF6794915.1 hypothetical protein CTRU02_05116 [Colletotrichum truncatum]